MDYGFLKRVFFFNFSYKSLKQEMKQLSCTYGIQYGEVFVKKSVLFWLRSCGRSAYQLPAVWLLHDLLILNSVDAWQTQNTALAPHENQPMISKGRQLLIPPSAPTVTQWGCTAPKLPLFNYFLHILILLLPLFFFFAFLIWTLTNMRAAHRKSTQVIWLLTSAH